VGVRERRLPLLASGSQLTLLQFAVHRLLEAALVLEAGLRRRFDRIVVVTCKPQQRIERWAQRFNLDPETAKTEVTRRMMAQAPDEAKIQAADYVIDNSGSVEATRNQVERVYETLLPQAKAKSA